MARGEPSWWYAARPGLAPYALAPASWLYGCVAAARMRLTTPERAARPVVCMGNFTAGGAGKTPLTIAVADIIRRLGHEPWVLSRGYGGRHSGPVRVELGTHTARDVGDEPLLLARTAPTVVARDRRAGAAFIASAAAANAVILMDDGLQNSSLAKDLTLAIVDGARGIGNGWVMPSGPLRAPLYLQTPLASALIVNSAREVAPLETLDRISDAIDGPTLRVWPEAAADVERWRGAAVVAYAGIANPDRFFTLLESLGARIKERRAFADHHPFTDEDAAQLLDEARRHDATLVTTEKDAARLAGATQRCAELFAASQTLTIRLAFADGDHARLTTQIARALQKK
ncbi:MAG: tetraacyldisaccharide 4'-kinase [Hyphomicrobium sp.]